MKRLFRTFVLLCFVLVSVSFFIASDPGDEFVKVSDISYRQERLESDYARTQCKLDVYYPKDIKGYPTIVCNVTNLRYLQQSWKYQCS